jgi:hypothetical protein
MRSTRTHTCASHAIRSGDAPKDVVLTPCYDTSDTAMAEPLKLDLPELLRLGPELSDAERAMAQKYLGPELSKAWLEWAESGVEAMPNWLESQISRLSSTSGQNG